jgi:hypothetical protein
VVKPGEVSLHTGLGHDAAYHASLTHDGCIFRRPNGGAAAAADYKPRTGSGSIMKGCSADGITVQVTMVPAAYRTKARLDSGRDQICQKSK